MKGLILSKLKNFVSEREWDKFHTPKNLLLALVGEVGELAEQFQWLTDEQSLSLNSFSQNQVSEELADIYLYLIILSEKLGIDLEEAALAKIQKNALKYPVEKVKGDSRKYNQYPES